jgi:NAD(P)H-dependent FMN reductase
MAGESSETSAVPESVLRWRGMLAASDAVLIASPEYGFSLPGALKNAIDWVIGSGELEGKVVAITAAVPGPEDVFRVPRKQADRFLYPDAPVGPRTQRHLQFGADLRRGLEAGAMDDHSGWRMQQAGANEPRGRPQG